MTRPNILLIHSDQHRYDCLGCTGHPLQRSPNLDRLANDGVCFDQAYCPSPICSPARASLLTGAWPHQHRCLSIPGTEIHRRAKDEFPCFSEILAEAGYGCSWIGKFHQEVSGMPTDHGFMDFTPEAAYVDWRRAQGIPELTKRPDFWFGECDPHVTEQKTRLHWGADRVLERMASHYAADRPFFVRWDPSEPHLPCRPPPELLAHYPVDAIEPWGSFGCDLSDRPYIQRQQLHTWRVQDWSWSDWAPVVARYHAEIECLDLQVGRLRAWLEDQGLLDNTLIIYSTDHGDLCGGHGMLDKHYIMYDEVMRVPVIARFPQRLASGMRCDAFVASALDIAATILDAAACQQPVSFAGRSLFAVADGSDPAPRSDIYASWHGGQFGSYTQRMIRERTLKYIWNATAVDELYDLERDPHERINRIADPSYAAHPPRLRKRLVTVMDELKDPALNMWTRDQLENSLMAPA
ncbi:MAG: sulfatase-like hydrolase/transferase [Planctomycetota bacterium]|jgi:arylsulfatase A-like enzyme|nr:sulfatase-like hydrolase/transferase [Planctomycetota bacterium]